MSGVTRDSDLVGLSVEVVDRIDSRWVGGREWSINVSEQAVSGMGNASFVTARRISAILNIVFSALLVFFLVLHFLRLICCECWSPTKEMPFLEVL
jgi:hypothetical protein